MTTPIAPAVFVDRSDRARLEVTGPDRAKFLHNLTTNDVKRLAVSHGQEAFVTSPQGKTLGHVALLALEDRILLRTDPGGLAAVTPHLQKYGVFDDVAFEDVSPHTFEFHVAGPAAAAIVQAAGGELPEEGDLRHRATRVGGIEVRVIREAPIGGTGFTLLGPSGSASAVSGALHSAGESLGLMDLDPSTYEALRIAAGTPVFGRDISVDNLPQEVGRDSLAINFVKGCYLGQETVARIDALGHVNKVLRGLKLRTRDVPAPGSLIESGGKPVGAVTSSAFSERRGTAVALGYVRTAQAKPGNEVLVAIGSEGRREVAVVSDLPMLPADE
jgi:folate-binding protein YgfZ